MSASTFPMSVGTVCNSCTPDKVNRRRGRQVNKFIAFTLRVVPSRDTVRGPVLIGSAARAGVQLTWWKKNCSADVSSIAVFVIVVFTATRVVPGPYCGSLGNSCCDAPVFYERSRVPVARQFPNQLPNTIYGACLWYGPTTDQTAPN